MNPIDANALERMAKERPDECFLKGSGVLKLTGAIRQLEAELRAAWRTVQRDGFPSCDGHTTYIGINSAGYACCFNAMRGSLCVMETAEGAYRQMSDLRDWRLLDRPALGVREVPHG
jgi:hypothetical protein